MLYIENVLSMNDFNLVVYCCSLLDSRLLQEKTDMVVRKNASVYRYEDSLLNDIFYGDFFLEKIHRILGFPVKPSTLPIDYRIYEVGGSMDWHRDEIIETPPQIEIVFTLENKSDSTTEWFDEKDIHSISTNPNSILITHGGGAYHRVLPVKRGFRSIIKIAYKSLAYSSIF